MNRTVIFFDKFHHRIHPRKFYRDFPGITELEYREFFNFSYSFGNSSRREYYDENGYVVAEIQVHNI